MDEIMKYLGIIAVVIVLALVFTTSGAADTTTPSPTPTPITAKLGDNVSVDYTLIAENGSVYDTTLASVASAAGIYRSSVNYAPTTFIIGSAGMLSGFENAAIGMRVNESKNFSLSPDEAYGEYNQSLLYYLPRNYTIDRVNSIPIATFLQAYPDFNFTTQSNLTLQTWSVAILSYNSSAVTIRYDPSVNQTIQTPSWPETAVAINETTITLRRDPTPNTSYVIPNQDGTMGIMTIRDVTDIYAVVDQNHPLAGQRLNFTITLVSINAQSANAT